MLWTPCFLKLFEILSKVLAWSCYNYLFPLLYSIINKEQYKSTSTIYPAMVKIQGTHSIQHLPQLWISEKQMCHYAFSACYITLWVQNMLWEAPIINKSHPEAMICAPQIITFISSHSGGGKKTKVANIRIQALQLLQLVKTHVLEQNNVRNQTQKYICR